VSALRDPLLTEVKSRGAGDVCLLVCDGFKGLPDATGEVWPAAVVQTSSVHNGRAEIVSVVTRTALRGRSPATCRLP
jgi:transposase-like protein